MCRASPCGVILIEIYSKGTVGGGWLRIWFVDNVDVPVIFADYYFLEALVRYRGRQNAGTR
ncbi:MAG TPA: hypothetical protein VGA99_04220 [bacterium]